MAQVFQQLCENLSSSMDRNELYKLANQLGLEVDSTMTKADFCSALSVYALSKVADIRQILATPSKKTQMGGYFDPVLNQQIDEDIQEGSDFADDLYDYDANMEDDQDIEDDNGLDDDDEDETGSEYQEGGYKGKRKLHKRTQKGGGNFDVEVPIGLVHRSYIGRLVKELPGIRAGAKAKLEFREDKKASDKNFATGSVWIITQNQGLLEDLRRKTAAFITDLENENLSRNPSSSSRVSKFQALPRGPIKETSGFEDTVKLPGPIHKRYIGQLIKSFSAAKRNGFETAKLQYVETSDDPNLGMGYVQVWSPNSHEEAVALGNIIEKNINELFEKAEIEKAQASQKYKDESKSTRNIAAELRGTPAPVSAGAVSSTKPKSPRVLEMPAGPSWADEDDDDDVPTPTWGSSSMSSVQRAWEN